LHIKRSLRKKVPCDGCLLLPKCIQKFLKAKKYKTGYFFVLTMDCKILKEYIKHPIFKNDIDLEKEFRIKNFYKNLIKKE